MCVHVYVHVYACVPMHVCKAVSLWYIHSLADTEKCAVSVLLCEVLTADPFKFGAGILPRRRDISIINPVSRNLGSILN